MKFFPLLALALAPALLSQSPLVCNPTASIPGNVLTFSLAGVNFYDIQVGPNDILLQALEIPTFSGGGVEGSFRVYLTDGTTTTTHVGNETNAAAWTQVAAGEFTSPGVVTIGLTCLTPGVLLQANTSYGIAVEHLGLLTEFVGVANFQTFSNAELTVSNGTTQAQPFLSAPQGPFTFGGVNNVGAQWRVAFVYDTNTANPHACSSVTRFGQGSGFNVASFYDLLDGAPAASAALSGTSMSLINTFNGYVVQPGSASYVPPTAAATTLPAVDDGEAPIPLSIPFQFPTAAGPGTTNTLFVHSNGYVSVAAQGVLTGPPIDPNTAMNATEGAYFSWHDYDPTEANSGQIKWEEDLASTPPMLYVTWEGVESKPDTTVNPSTFQFQFNLSNGDVTYVWDTIDAVGGSTLFGGDDTMVGWSPAGVSPPVTEFDYTTLAPFAVTLPEALPLDLEYVNEPLLGNTIDIVTSNEPTVSAGVNLLSTSVLATPVPLAPLGALTGAEAWLDIAVSTPNVITNATGPAGMVIQLPIPVNPALVGLEVFSQSFWLDFTGMGLFDGLSASNGVSLVVGTF